MPRLTRAKAAQVAEDMHIDEDALLELPGSENGDVELKASTPNNNHSTREPLGEITPNSSGSKSEGEQSAEEQPKKTRGKKRGKKAEKETKGLAASTASQPELYDSPEAAGDDNVEDTPAAQEEPTSAPEKEDKHANVEGARPKSPPAAAAARLTRSRMGRKADTGLEVVAEPKSLAEEKEQFQQTPDLPSVIESQTDKEQLDAEADTESTGMTALDAPASPLPTAMPNVIHKLRRDIPAKRSASNKENVEPLEDSAAMTPTISVASENGQIAEARPQTPISSSAYDALEAAAIEAATPPVVSRRASSVAPPDASTSSDAIAAIDALDDAVEKVTAELPDVTASPEKPKSKKREAPVVRMTKGSQARISLAQGNGKRAPSLGPPRQSMGLGRSLSVRQTSTTKPDPAGNRVLSTSSNKSTSAGDGEKKEVVIPHSKPRPISMSFPAPKPLVKSVKPTTKSTFQLPGEAVAAKLKAAREERAQKEDDATKKTFKARPAPSAPKVAPTVRQTNSSKFRESLMNAKDVKPAGHRRANSVAAPKPRVVSKTPATDITEKHAGSTLHVKKRPSTAMANIGKQRMSLIENTSTAPIASIGERVTGKGTAKGKEVFNRAAAAKEAAEKEKREKEAAAKKARAAAAETGRQASREWAQKQKLKKMGLKAEAKPASDDKSDVVEDASASQMATSTDAPASA